MKVDCNTCFRRGQINGLSQETYCSMCVHGTPYKKDYYSEYPKGGIPHANCDGCARGLPIIDGLHRVGNKERFACTADRYL